ncbi:MAG: hypothetical protein MUC63_11025 [Planctomycetes bacterium]|nr:hypothetical protein [Planctomycetota bacterium]
MYDPAANTWASRHPLAQGRSEVACVAAGGCVFAIGGWKTGNPVSTVEAYNPDADTWSLKASLPSPSSAMGCVAWGGRIYAVGGWQTSGNLFREYNVPSDTWTLLTPLTSYRGGVRCALVGDTIYANGGISGGPPLATTEAFPLRTGFCFFTAQNPLPSGVSRAGLAAVGGKVCLTGGTSPSTAALADCREFQAAADVPATGSFKIRAEWASTASMAAARRDAGSDSCGGYVYVAGGFDASNAALASMERFDPAAGTWAASVPMPTLRGGLRLACSGGKLYAAGGDNGLAKSSALEIFDPSSSTWSAGASMAVARSHFGMGVEPVSGMLYVFGGEGSGGTCLSSIERYDPALGAWTTMTATLPVGLKGTLCLWESFSLKLFGGQKPDGAATEQVFAYEHWADRVRVENVVLPYPARDLAGCTLTHAWNHRGTPQREEFCLLGGGFDGTNHRAGFFRFYTR